MTERGFLVVGCSQWLLGILWYNVIDFFVSITKYKVLCGP